MQEITVKCPICSKPYKVYQFTAADQSACPSCVREAEKETVKGHTYSGEFERFIR